MAYFAGLLGDFDRYLARGDGDLLRDQVSYRLAAGDGFDRAFGAAGDAAVHGPHQGPRQGWPPGAPLKADPVLPAHPCGDAGDLVGARLR
jgi:hypothetical protein